MARIKRVNLYTRFEIDGFIIVFKDRVLNFYHLYFIDIK